MESSRRSRVFLGAAAVLVVFAAAVAWQSSKSQLASPPTPTEKLTIALSNTFPGSGLLYVAAAKGFYAQEGLDVTLQPYTNGLDAMKAVLGKRADLGTTGDTPLMFAVMDGQPVSIVATIFTAGGALGTVARRDRGISTVADLKGKAVGVTRRTDGEFFLSSMLARSNTAARQVQIEPLPPETMVDALLAGKVDAVATWEPWLSRASKALGENGVMFRIDSGVLTNYSLVGNAQWVRANPDKVQRLLRAMLRAEKFAKENQNEAQAIIVKSLGLDPSTFATGGTRYHFVVLLSQRLLIMLEDMARWAIVNNLTNRTTVPNFLDVMNMDALTVVKPDAVTIVR